MVQWRQWPMGTQQWRWHDNDDSMWRCQGAWCDEDVQWCSDDEGHGMTRMRTVHGDDDNDDAWWHAAQWSTARTTTSGPHQANHPQVYHRPPPPAWYCCSPWNCAGLQDRPSLPALTMEVGYYLIPCLGENTSYFFNFSCSFSDLHAS